MKIKQSVPIKSGLEIKKHVRGKVILITGGTGSFGNSVIGKLLGYNPKKIIIYSRDEKKQHDMRNRFDNSLLNFVIGDVRDKESVNSVMKGVDYVFHAAALKQVPTAEFFPMESIKTNILGAHNVMNGAIENKVKKLVILSTDKAVYPINAMGMSKALMEKIMIAESRNIHQNNSSTTVCGVRYGNVLYSRGSVIPYFASLIRQGKKLVVTNSDMTRFLLPLRDAVDLILYALIFGENGYMYIRKSPACTIQTLTEALCELFDYKKGHKEVGLRAGEKMHETLISKEEMIRVIDAGNYYKIPPESQGLDYNKYFFRGKKLKINTFQPYTSENTEQLDVKGTKKLLLTLPEIQEELKNQK